MDNLKKHLVKISTETCEVRMEDIQEARKDLEKIRNAFGNSIDMTYSHKVLAVLWHHMENGFSEFEDQLLCSTCFYAILVTSNEIEHYLRKVLEFLNYELDLKENGDEVSKRMYNTISLTYGIFHSLILQQNLEESTLTIILEKIFKLLTIMAYEYSQYTFITFKILTSFKKAVGTAYQSVLFNKKHNLKLLSIVNHNWENPITGVRGLNKIIFHNLVSIVDEDIFKIIENKINGFYWNKAKYLMLAEIVEHYQGNIMALLNKYNMVEGLTYSLKKAGLVSAGADLYASILNKLTKEVEWCDIFLPCVIKAAKGSSLKPVEHFNNYWCLNTLKKFPSLSEIICGELKNMDTTDHKLFSYLCVIQQSNRLGLLEKYFVNCNILEEYVIDNVDHMDANVRSIAFSIVCSLHSKFLPHKTEYDLILNFLKNNVSSDCSVLRINMIKSLKNFLVQLHVTFINNAQINKDCDIRNMTTFCKLLQIFAIESTEMNGNYQRKVTTIQIIKVMLNIFKEIPRKKQKGTKPPHTTLLEFLKDTNQWVLFENKFIFKMIDLLKDPCKDIRDHVKDVLMNNYSQQLCNNEMLTYLADEALSSLRNRFFYQISCGQTIFKLIINILLTETCAQGKFKQIEDIYDFAYDKIRSECDSNLDIVKSVVEGKQLHSYLNVLLSVFEESLEKSHELKITMPLIYSLIKFLDKISNQFVWEQESSISSDFSKMNDMVQTMILNSEYQICSHFNETNISGLHQIVLNCLWLNVKASCELSTILIRYYGKNGHRDICEECLKIICNVLETSRHKGAIEAAGSALGQAIRQLTSLCAGSVNSQLPLDLLKRKIKQFVLEASNMASVTRRGAGLSIMIHQIVSNDMKKRKPLFHYFMQTLLETCNTLPEYCNDGGEVDTNNEKDLPQANFIHFLTKIVTDSNLASDIMYYSDKLAKLAFDNLSSSCWQIRNAALQLYGSLIPKLIGQKKNSGISEEVIATVAVDEFRTHSPKLWRYIETQLLATAKLCSDIVKSHNNLLPILNILANLAPVYSFTEEMRFKEDLLPSFIILLGSPIYVIRRLTSKCFLNVYSFEVISEVLLSYTCETENSLHGALVLLCEFNKQYHIRNMVEYNEQLRNKYKILTSRQCSYLSKELFESVFPECINLTDKMLQETLAEMHEKWCAPGIFLWENFRIKLYLEKASWDRISQALNTISDCCNFNTYCETLCRRIQEEKIIQEEILLQLGNSLYSLGFKRKSSIIWKTLFEISLHTQLLNKHLDISLLKQYILHNVVCYAMRYMIVFAARIFTHNESLFTLSNIIFNLSDPETDADMRMIGAMANNELANKFEVLSDSIRINAIKAAIMFLQDEDEEVRNMSAQFHIKILTDEIATHPYVAWRRMLSNKFFIKALRDPNNGIQSLCNEVLDLLQSQTGDNEDEYNPFANDSKNMYLEPVVLETALKDLKGE